MGWAEHVLRDCDRLDTRRTIPSCRRSGRDPWAAGRCGSGAIVVASDGDHAWSLRPRPIARGPRNYSGARTCSCPPVRTVGPSFYPSVSSRMDGLNLRWSRRLPRKSIRDRSLPSRLNRSAPRPSKTTALSPTESRPRSQNRWQHYCGS